MRHMGHAPNVPFLIYAGASHRFDGWRFCHQTNLRRRTPMKREFQQYRFAWIEGNNITRARLESQFKDKLDDFAKLERAIERELAEHTNCVPWRTSDVERMGCRDGARMAALEFFWARCLDLRCENVATAVETPSLQQRD